MVIFHSYVSLPEGSTNRISWAWGSSPAEIGDDQFWPISILRVPWGSEVRQHPDVFSKSPEWNRTCTVQYDIYIYICWETTILYMVSMNHIIILTAEIITFHKHEITWSHRISPADNIFLVRSFRDWCRSFTQTWLRNRIVHITLHIIHVHPYMRMFHRVHR